MTARILVSGALFKPPEEHVSKAGRFRHEPGHSTARTRDQVHNPIAASLAIERALDGLDLAPDTAHAGIERRAPLAACFSLAITSTIFSLGRLLFAVPRKLLQHPLSVVVSIMRSELDVLV
jgi:hypothetical protein